MSRAVLCVVPDLDDELTGALSLLDEALSHLAGWLQEPEPPIWPAPLGNRAALQAFGRVAAVLRATQGLQGRLRWFAPDGNYEHAPLRFIHLDESDLDTLAAAAHELGRALHPGAGAPDELDQALETAGDAAGVPAVDLVSTLARLHGLLTLEPTDDVALLDAAAQRAGGTVKHDPTELEGPRVRWWDAEGPRLDPPPGDAGDEHRLVLSPTLEAAYQRTVGRLNGIWALGDPLARFVY